VVKSGAAFDELSRAVRGSSGPRARLIRHLEWIGHRACVLVPGARYLLAQEVPAEREAPRRCLRWSAT
jgi:hypothetical protein